MKQDFYETSMDITADLAAGGATLNLDGNYPVVPKGILINKNLNEEETVVGTLMRAKTAGTYKIKTGIPIELGFKSITKAGTTIETIHILGDNI